MIYDELDYIKEITSTVEPKSKNTFEYDKRKQLSKVTNDTFYSKYSYDNDGKVRSCGIGSKQYIDVNYDTVSQWPQTKITNTYGNGYSAAIIKDKYNRTTEVKEGNTTKIKYLYCDERNDVYEEGSRATSAARLRAVEDHYIGLKYNYNYDYYDGLEGFTCTDRDGNEFLKIKQEKLTQSGYDVKETATFKGNKIETYSKTEKGKVTKFRLGDSGDVQFEYVYDGFGNIKNIKSYWDTKDITYNYNQKDKTELIESVYDATEWQETNIIETDKNDRTKITSSKYEKTDSNKKTSNIVSNYTYDDSKRLKTDTKSKNNNPIYCKEYEYDSKGNRTKRTVGNETTTYNYNAYNQLTKIIDSGKTLHFTYDEIGNPTRYKTTSNTSSPNMTWTRGRYLSKYNGVSFEYSGNGTRLRKTANGITKTYYYNGSKLIGEVWTNGLDKILDIVYHYDAMGLALITIKKDIFLRSFRYVMDCQGNVTELIDISDKTKVLRYNYDAFGNMTIENDLDLKFGNVTLKLSEVNPFTYRSYYWDHETKLYYLMTRYYDPDTGRFINADDISYLDPMTIGGLNLYTYCGNDPINKYDPTGHFPWLILAALLLFTPVGGTALQVTTSALSYAGMAVASIFDEDIRNDMNAIGWNPFNTDESATLNSNKVSFYKGVPVFRTNGGRSGSFGAIFLSKGNNVDDLRHERGHNWQLMMMGIANFALMIGLPSWQGWSKRKYYDRPWEITADLLGEVNGRSHNKVDIKRGYWYLGVSSLFGPFGYFYLFGEY